MTEDLLLDCSFLWEPGKPRSRHFSFEPSTLHLASFWNKRRQWKDVQLLVKTLTLVAHEMIRGARGCKLIIPPLFPSWGHQYRIGGVRTSFLWRNIGLWTDKSVPLQKSSAFKIIFIASNSLFQHSPSKILCVTAKLISNSNSHCGTEGKVWHCLRKWIFS